MATHGKLFLKMTACGDSLLEAQRREAKALARFEAHPTEEGSEEWRRARHLVENRAREYMAVVRAWRETSHKGIAVNEASQHISPELREQLLWAGLPQSEVAAIAEHLRTCSECRCQEELWEFWGGMGGEQPA